MKVVLVVDVTELKDKNIFEKHLKKEGFSAILDEDFAYEGDTSTHLFSTRAFVLEVVEKGLLKSGFSACRMMFQVGANPMEAYSYNIKTKEFELIEI